MDGSLTEEVPMPKVAKKKSKKSAAKKAAPLRRGPAKKKVVAKKAASPKKVAKKVVRKAARTVSRHVAKKAVKKTAAKPKKSAAIAKPKNASTAKPQLKPKKPIAPPLPKRPPPGEAEASSSRPSSARRREDGSAFLPDPKLHRPRRAKDDLAEELGEDFLAGATGEAVDDARDATLDDEDGGPFVTTSAESQYAHGTDASNPEDAEQEAFPTTRSDLS
jgi:hypothetical protein